MLYATGQKRVQLNLQESDRIHKVEKDPRCCSEGQQQSSCPLVKIFASGYSTKYRKRSGHMKLASIKPNDLAIVKNEHLIPLSTSLPAGLTMIDVIAGYERFKA